MDKAAMRLLREDWIEKEDLALFDKAVARIEKRTPNAFERQTVNHGMNLSKNELFGSIDKMIAFLTDLKKKGYESVSENWSGYEDNYFVADKYELQTDEEAAHAFYRKIDYEMRAIEKEEEAIEAKQKKIRELEDELRKLKKRSV